MEQFKEFVILPSATRNTAGVITSAVITNNNFKSLNMFLDITANASAVSLTLNVLAVGLFFTSATLTGFGAQTVSTVFSINPSVSAEDVAGNVQQTSRPLPFKFQIEIAHSAANDITYSLAGAFSG